MKKQIITAMIPAYNEEKNIADCIKSVLWCDRVVVLNMGHDNTENIAKKLKADVINKFKTQKPDFKLVQIALNWAIDNCSTDWMLRIDADERVTTELKSEILILLQNQNSKIPGSPAGRKNQSLNKKNKNAEKITNNINYLNPENSKLKPNIVAFGIPRNQYFLGEFLKGGDWAYDRLVRLFKPKYCRYDPVVSVHEQFKVNGKISYLKNPLLHYSHPTTKELFEKFNIYTDAEIKDLDDSLISALLKLIFMPPYIFGRWTIYHHGYRDGLRGVLAGLARSYYDFLLYFKYINYRLKK